MKRFKEKVVIVTGAASGLGLATAQRLAAEGASLVLVDLKEESLDKAQRAMPEGTNAISVVADVSDLEQVKGYVRKTLDTYGKIDGFFNNAGIEGKQNITEDFGKDEFERVVAINLNGVFFGMAEVLKV